MGEHELRLLDERDVPALQELMESDPGFSERTTGHPPGTSDGMSALLDRPEGVDEANKFGFGLWDAGVLVAFADVLRGFPGPEFGYIGLLITRGDRQRRGYGRELHDRVLDEMRTWGEVTRIRLGIVATNADAAEPFWRSMGYQPTGVVRPYQSDALTTTVAVWELQL